MLYRKAHEKIMAWIAEGKKALLVEGARQVGKSFLIDECLEESGFPFVKLDLIRDKRALQTLTEAANEGLVSILEALSYFAPEPNEKGKPIVFIDEVQLCPELITMVKYLVQDGTYRYIFSGSLLGIALAHARSLPVGYMGILTMYPLDFEEFLIANKFNEKSLKAIREAFENEQPLNEQVHQEAMRLFKRYLLVGGMPDAVNEYVTSHNLRKTSEVQTAIRELYKADFTKRQKGNPLILERIYDMIPLRLREQNRRFFVSDLAEGASFSDYDDDFYWLQKAGAVIPVYNASSPSLPHEIFMSQKLVKLYYNDVGLLCSTYGDAFGQSVLSNEDANLGGVYENFVASALLASSFPTMAPFYFKARKIGELDFLTSFKGVNAAIEVKSGKYYLSHQSLEKMMAIPNYGIKNGIVLCNGNVQKMNGVTYLPIYMAGLIS